MPLCDILIQLPNICFLNTNIPLFFKCTKDHLGLIYWMNYIGLVDAFFKTQTPKVLKMCLLD